MNSERLQLNNSNIENIRRQIEKKNNGNPYFVTEKESKSVITDFDHFPYNRWWRGIAGSCNPVVIERESGWRIRNDNCYKNDKKIYKNENIYDCKLINKIKGKYNKDSVLSYLQKEEEEQKEVLKTLTTEEKILLLLENKLNTNYSYQNNNNSNNNNNNNNNINFCNQKL